MNWMIKGVREETREAVRQAASQADLLIGEWVDQALRDAAREAMHPSPPPATKADVELLLKELDEVKASVQALAQRGERPQPRPEVRHVMVEKRKPARSAPPQREKGPEAGG